MISIVVFHLVHVLRLSDSSTDILVAQYFVSVFYLVPVVPFSRLDGGVLLGPLPIVTSVLLVSVPDPHPCACSLECSCAYSV